MDITGEVRLNGMKFYAYHGVGEQEQIVGNRFVVSVQMETRMQSAVACDDLAGTINYAEAYNVVATEMAIPSRLLEHVAGRIIQSLWDTFPKARAVRVEVAKLTPPFGGDVHSASVVLSANRS